MHAYYIMYAQAHTIIESLDGVTPSYIKTNLTYTMYITRLASEIYIQL